VIIWSRLAFPLANVILLLLAVPLTFRQSTHTALIGVSLSVIMSLLYFFVNSVSIDLAYRRFFLWDWPFFAGVFPTAIFATVGVWLYVKMDEV
jgi:lipopolysaccharide export LptBFGC system permease protein LptF